MADLSRRAVIFDLDGVLTDTAEFHYRGWQRLADEEGIPFDRSANEALRGVPRRESLLYLLGDREVGEDRIQEMMARKNRYYAAFLGDMSPDDLLPGALDLVVDAKRRGFEVAIGSSSKNARRVLDALQITDLFDAIADGHTVEQAKPAPDLFLAAAAAVGVPPAACVVIEDAGSGVDAALAAGMVAVGVGPEQRVGHAHHRFDTVAEVDLGEVVAPEEHRVADGPLVADGWVVTEDRHDPSIAATVAARHLAADGDVGCHFFLPEWSPQDGVACTVAGTWDVPGGRASGVHPAPYGLHAQWSHDGVAIEVPPDSPVDDRRVLERWFDIRYGRQCRRLSPGGGPVTQLIDQRFVGMDRGGGVVVQRQRLVAAPGIRLTVSTGLDATAAHGADPVADLDPDVHADALTMRIGPAGLGPPVSAAHAVSMAGGAVVDELVEQRDRRLVRTLEVVVGEAGAVTLTQVMATDLDDRVDDTDGPQTPLTRAREAIATGYDLLLLRHVRAWDRLWRRLDVVVEGDPIVQTALRFALYHHAAATPRQPATRPVPPAGLARPTNDATVGPQQEEATLPVWLYTFPEVARDLLLSRRDRRDALPPDVLAHVALAVDRYVRATGDLGVLAADGWPDPDGGAPGAGTTAGSLHAAVREAARRGRPDEARDLIVRHVPNVLMTAGAAHGVDTAACGRLWQAVVLGLGAVEVDEDGVRLDTRLPTRWDRLEFGLAARSCWIDVRIEPATVEVRAATDNPHPLPVQVLGRQVGLAPGDTATFARDDAPADRVVEA